MQVVGVLASFDWAADQSHLVETVWLPRVDVLASFGWAAEQSRLIGSGYVLGVDVLAGLVAPPPKVGG